MPSSLAMFLVFASGLLPGFAGNYAYSMVNGSDWRDKEWENVLRLVAFSVVGLTLYSCLAQFAGFIPALHLIPRSYERDQLEATRLLSMLLPLSGHALCALLGGYSAAKIHRRVAVSARTSAESSTWDHFIRVETARRWVVVTLSSGEVYAGVLHMAERGVQHGERDVILRYPSLYNDEGKSYQVLQYRDIYVPASMVQTIGTLRETGDEDQLVRVGQLLFQEHQNVEPEAIKSVSATFEPGAGTAGRSSKGRILAAAADDASERVSAASPINAYQKVALPDEAL